MTEERKACIKAIGMFLKQKRQATGVTQKEISDAADLTTAQYISNVERGLVAPSNDLLTTYISVCSLDLNEVVDFMCDQQNKALKAELKKKVQA